MPVIIKKRVLPSGSLGQRIIKRRTLPSVEGGRTVDIPARRILKEAFRALPPVASIVQPREQARAYEEAANVAFTPYNAAANVITELQEKGLRYPGVKSAFKAGLRALPFGKVLREGIRPESESLTAPIEYRRPGRIIRNVTQAFGARTPERFGRVPFAVSPQAAITSRIPPEIAEDIAGIALLEGPLGLIRHGGRRIIRTISRDPTARFGDIPRLIRGEASRATPTPRTIPIAEEFRKVPSLKETFIKKQVIPRRPRALLESPEAAAQRTFRQTLPGQKAFPLPTNIGEGFVINPKVEALRRLKEAQLFRKVPYEIVNLGKFYKKGIPFRPLRITPEVVKAKLEAQKPIEIKAPEAQPTLLQPKQLKQPIPYKKEDIFKGIKGETPKKQLLKEIDQAISKTTEAETSIRFMGKKLREPWEGWKTFKVQGTSYKIENSPKALSEFKNRIEKGITLQSAVTLKKGQPGEVRLPGLRIKLTEELGQVRLGRFQERKPIIPPVQPGQVPSKVIPKRVIEEPEIKRPGEAVTRETAGGKILPIKSKSGITIQKEIVEGAEGWHDLTKAEIQLLDQTRQLEKVAGPLAPKLKEFIVRPREQAVTNLVNEKHARMLDLKQTVMEQFGIRQKTKESAAVQRYGEKKLSLDELKRQFPQKWQNIVQAERYFRAQYDELLSRLNQVQVRNGYKPTPKRQDYFTHFQEASNIFEQVTQAERGIETSLAGVSEVTQPGRPFNPFRLPRKGEKTVVDAVQGYSRYLNPVLSEIHLTDTVARIRTFKRAVTEVTKETRNLNNFIIALRDSADQLALKKNRLDTVIQDNAIGYRVVKTVDWIRRRLGKSAILYNVSSAISNTLPIQQLITEIGPARTLKAMYSAMADAMGKDFVLTNSKFLQRRFKDIGLKDVDPRGFQRADITGAWLFKKIDSLATRTIWSGLYDRAIRKGLTSEKSILRADEEINKLVAGRAIGEIPTAFTSRLAQVGFQFQTEVNNYINYAFRDIGFKDPVKLTTFFIYAYLMNTLFEQVMNRRPLLDPIDAAVDAFKSEGPAQAVGRLAGEWLSNVPGGQLLANLYPQYGMTVVGLKLPTKEKFFGRSEAGRFGPIPISSIYRHPISSLVTGGGQLRKTFGGLKAVSSGRVENRRGKRLFGIAGPAEAVQSVFFGPYATGEEKPKKFRLKGLKSLKALSQ